MGESSPSVPQANREVRDKNKNTGQTHDEDKENSDKKKGRLPVFR
jgi:hypothetical protein